MLSFVILHLNQNVCLGLVVKIALNSSFNHKITKGYYSNPNPSGCIQLYRNIGLYMVKVIQPRKKEKILQNYPFRVMNYCTILIEIFYHSIILHGISIRS